MSDIARRPPTPAQLTLAPEQFRAVMANPLHLLPPAVRPAAYELWMCHKTKLGMETELAIAVPVSIWINKFGLLPADAAAVLGRMQHPEKMAGQVYGAHVIDALAAEVAAVLRRRGQEAEQAEARRKREEDRANAADLEPGQLHAMTAGIGRDPRG